MKKIANFISTHDNLAIFAHIKTDCDAVCSSLALKLALNGINKKADVFIDSNFSTQMESLPHFDLINKQTIEKYDAYICLDTATLDRLGKHKYKIMKHRNNSYNIDHHGTNEAYSKNNYINEQYSSTCELLFDLFKIMNIEITPEIAHLLLVGIYTDSGQLSYSCTTNNTAFVVSKLIAKLNGTIDTVLSPIYRNKSLQDFELTKLVYEKITLSHNNELSIVILNNNDFKKVGSNFEQTHGLVDIALQLSSVKVSIVASQDENQENCFYVSIRSKGETSARAIGEAFGGGGHFNAAGCKIFDTEENVYNRLLSVSIEVLNA